MNAHDFEQTEHRTAARWRTALLFVGFVLLVGLIAWPSFIGRIHYARTRAELAAMADAAAAVKREAVATVLPSLYICMNIMSICIDHVLIVFVCQRHTGARLGQEGEVGAAW